MKQIVPGPCCQLTEIPALLSFDEIRLAFTKAASGQENGTTLQKNDKLSQISLPTKNVQPGIRNSQYLSTAKIFTAYSLEYLAKTSLVFFSKFIFLCVFLLPYCISESFIFIGPQSNHFVFPCQ